MRNRIKGNKIIDIHLNEEKFYFPGEIIKGAVIVHPKSSTRTNQIRVKFTGEILVSIKDKEIIQLFQKTEILSVSEGKNTKTHVLEAREHSFPFEFRVPDDDNFPSSMEYGKRKTRVSYTLIAIHDRPMVPESLCSKAEYSVPVLQYINVAGHPFTKPQERVLEFMLPGAMPDQKCHLRVSMSRYGYTRGEVVDFTVAIHHFKEYARKNGITVELIRAVDIRTGRNMMSKEDVLKSTDRDIELSNPELSQAIPLQLLVPTSTPPTISYKEKILNIQYKIRIRLYLVEKKNTETEMLDIPIVVGTWPRATIPIDDDGDDYEDTTEKSGGIGFINEDDERGYAMYRGNDGYFESLAPEHQKKQSISLLSVSSSSSSIQMIQNATATSDVGVYRSESVVSHTSNHSQGSEFSRRSSQFHDNCAQPYDASFKSATPKTVDRKVEHGYNNDSNMTNSAAAYISNVPSSSAPVSRSSSTPNFLLQTSSNHDSMLHRAQMTSYNVYTSITQLNHQQQSTEDYSISLKNANYTVPIHTLTPVHNVSTSGSYIYGSGNYSSASGPTQNLEAAQVQRVVETNAYGISIDPGSHQNQQFSQSSYLDGSDDSDDDDLFAIIEKKKKQERAMRQV